MRIVAGAVKTAAILPSYPYIRASLLQLFNGLPMCFTPLVQSEEKHISALRLGDLNTFVLLPNVFAGEVHIIREYLVQLIHPLVALRLVAPIRRAWKVRLSRCSGTRSSPYPPGSRSHLL